MGTIKAESFICAVSVLTLLFFYIFSVSPNDLQRYVTLKGIKRTSKGAFAFTVIGFTVSSVLTSYFLPLVCSDGDYQSVGKKLAIAGWFLALFILVGLVLYFKLNDMCYQYQKIGTKKIDKNTETKHRAAKCIFVIGMGAMHGFSLMVNLWTGFIMYLLYLSLLLLVEGLIVNYHDLQFITQSEIAMRNGETVSGFIIDLEGEFLVVKVNNDEILYINSSEITKIKRQVHKAGRETELTERFPIIAGIAATISRLRMNSKIFS